jgi:hypothetical protein
MSEEFNKTSGTYISENIGMLPSVIPQSNFRKVLGMEPLELAFWMINTGLLVLITMKEFAFL